MKKDRKEGPENERRKDRKEPMKGTNEGRKDMNLMKARGEGMNLHRRETTRANPVVLDVTK